MKKISSWLVRIFSLIDDLKTRAICKHLLEELVERSYQTMKEELARLKVASFHVKENSVFAILSLLVSWAIDFRQKPR